MSEPSTFKSFFRINPQISWAVDLRKNHRHREAFVRGAGGTFSILGVALALFSSCCLASMTSAYQDELSGVIVNLLMGLSALISGIGLCSLRPWILGSVLVGGLVSIVFALFHWQLGAGAIAAHLYVLSLLCGKAGREMLSFTYSQAIKITPALNGWVSILVTHMIVTSAGLIGGLVIWTMKRGCP